MKCFNHVEREAVATCQRCGKALCKECAEKYMPCLCETCAAALQLEQKSRMEQAENAKRQKYLSSLIDTRSEFIRACFFGVIWGGIVLFVCTYGYFSKTSIPNIIMYFLWGFTMPFGWKLTTSWQARLPVVITDNWAFWLGWLGAKVLMCMVLSIPAFIYQLVKTVSAQRAIKESQQ